MILPSLQQPVAARPWRAAWRPQRASGRLAAHSSSDPSPREGGPASSPNSDVLARIQAARQYKSTQQQQAKTVAGQPAQQVSRGAAVGVEPAGGTTSSPPAAQQAAAPGSAAEAALARISAAREYRQEAERQQRQSMPGPPAAPQAAAPLPAASGLAGVAQGQPGGPPPPSGQTTVPVSIADLGERLSQGAGAGSSQQAAGWLTTVVSGEQPQLDPNMAPETFTRLKDELMKKQGGEVIVGTFQPVNRRDRMPPAAAQPTATAPALDTAAAPDAEQLGQPLGQQGEPQEGSQVARAGRVHKPKVATWGVFPRPQNISEAYGGGRNLRPGQALESEQQAQEREARIAKALAGYRKTLGLDIDPHDEAKASALCEEGAALFKQAALAAALEKYAAAAALLPARSIVGGEARLRQALCLDSLGRNQEAYEIYKQIKGHPTAAVAKQANRMLFGFKAAESLKVSTMSYAPPSQAWKNYFDRISRSSWTSTYYTAASSSGLPGDSAEGDSKAEMAAAALAVGVLLAPLALVGYHVLQQQPHQ
ncbi:hypothetical protein N2152v2_004516 [Parachlorella kessleri]